MKIRNDAGKSLFVLVVLGLMGVLYRFLKPSTLFKSSQRREPKMQRSKEIE